MSQKQLLKELLSDGKPHRTDEIMDKVYGGSHLGLARVGARIWDLKKDGCQITGWKDPDNPALYWYQMAIGDRIEEYENKNPQDGQSFCEISERQGELDLRAMRQNF